MKLVIANLIMYSEGLIKTAGVGLENINMCGQPSKHQCLKRGFKTSMCEDKTSMCQEPSKHQCARSLQNINVSGAFKTSTCQEPLKHQRVSSLQNINVSIAFKISMSQEPSKH